MKSPKISLILALFVSLCFIFAGCMQTQYVCPDGSTASSPSSCPQIYEHGCDPNAGYEWCEPLQQCIRPWETNCTAPAKETPECVTVADCGLGAASCVNGKCSQYDEHGCVPDGGYTWCEEKQKCIRPWEEECVSEQEVQTQPNVQTPRIMGATFTPTKVTSATTYDPDITKRGFIAQFEGNLQVGLSGTGSDPVQLIRLPAGSGSVYCSGGVCNLPITNEHTLDFYKDEENSGTSTKVDLCINDYSNCDSVSVNIPTFSITVSDTAVSDSTQDLYIYNDNSFEIDPLVFQLYDSHGSTIPLTSYSVIHEDSVLNEGRMIGLYGEGYMIDLAPGEGKFYHFSSNQDLGRVTVVVSVGERDRNFFSKTATLFIEPED